MIKITVDKNTITIQGHSGYEESGKDIVCSSVSSIAITTVNAILKFDSSAIKYDEKDGYLKVEILKESRETLVLIDNMIDLLKSLEKQYKKYISLKIIEGGAE